LDTKPDQPDADSTAGTGPDAATEAARRTGTPKPPELPHSRPPLWLVVLTLAIPVSIGIMWYSNWYGRKLSAPQVAAGLASDNLSNQSHALHQFIEHVSAWRMEPSSSPLKEQKRDEVEALARAVVSFSTKSNASEQIQESVARSLGIIAELPFDDIKREARSKLEDMLLGGKKLVRIQAACALSKFDDRSQAVIDVLRLALAEEDPRFRLNAAWALGRVGDRNVADLLQQRAVSDSDSQVREVARAAYELAKGR